MWCWSFMSRSQLICLYKKWVFMYFTTLQHVILIKRGSFSRIFYPSKVSENLTPCYSGYSRKVAVLENGGAAD